MIKNKRGGEKLFSIWWFLILGITAISIGYGVVLYFSQDIDIREFEAGIIYSNIGNCIVNNNAVSDEVFKDNFDIYSYCHLNQKSFDQNFYLNLTFKDKDGDTINEIIAGNYQLQKQCEIVFDTKNVQKLAAVNYARCYFSKESISYFSEGYSGEGSVEILSASNNLGRKISIV